MAEPVSRARLLLHGVALIAPFAAAALGAYLLTRNDRALMARQALMFGSLAALAAQIAVALRWRALERRALDGSGAWRTGIGIALITHVLFGALFTIAIALSLWWIGADDASSFSQQVLQGIFFTAISLSAVGLITFPLTMLVVAKIGDLRREELRRGAR